MRTALAVLAFGAMVLPTLAQEPAIDRSKIYVSEPSACAALEKSGVDAFMEESFLALSFNDGIQSMEFHCAFYDIKAKANSSQLFVDAICELPGQIYPDTLAISPWDDKTIQVVSSYDLTSAGFTTMAGDEPIAKQTDQGQSPGATLFTRCDTISELPRD